MLDVDRRIRHELQPSAGMFVVELSLQTAGLGCFTWPEQRIAELARLLVLEGADGDWPHSRLRQDNV